MKYLPLRHLPSLLRKTRPVQCTIFLTRRCNARCPFCFYLAGSSPAGAGEELSVDEFEKIAGSCPDLLWLAFSGGEIFLRDDLVEITRIFYEKTRPVFILLPTNGLLPETILRKTEEILQKCPKSTVTVKLSLDGPAALHDELRGVAGAFAKSMATYRLLSGLRDRYPNLELGFNTVFCAANQDRMEETIRFVRGLDHSPPHTISLVRGALRRAGLKDVCQEKYGAASRMLAAGLRDAVSGRYRFCGGRLKAAQDIVQRNLIRETVRQEKQVIPCYAGKLTAVITETGEVYACESFSGKLGSLRAAGYDLQAVLADKAAREKVASIERGECHCTHECYFIMNILFNPALYPALIREYLKL